MKRTQCDAMQCNAIDSGIGRFSRLTASAVVQRVRGVGVVRLTASNSSSMQYNNNQSINARMRNNASHHQLIYALQLPTKGSSKPKI